jgi:hypothetical protein
MSPEGNRMVQLFVGGQPVGVIPDPEGLIVGLVARNQKAEPRDDAGNRIAVITPDAPSRPAGGPIIPWEPDVTEEEIQRRMAEPGFTFEEVKKRLGWE